MTDLHRIDTTFHTAVLAPLEGHGLLILPDERTDVLLHHDSAVESLHATSLREMDLRLSGMGWEIPEADDIGHLDARTGGVDCGTTLDGRCLVMLYGPSIVEQPSIEEIETAEVALRQLAGEIA